MSHVHESEKFGTIDLDTLAGVQTALGFLGYDAGAVDGIDGPNTQAAVRSFQSDQGLKADGIAGPNTKKALLAALESAASSDEDREGHEVST
jgi:peptidoglycan hydrolase-like protein with peptidoglycan-binding domain